LAADASWGETDLNIQDTTSVLPYDRNLTLTDKPWDVARQIASIPGNYRPLHYDESGRLTFILDPDPNQLTPVRDVWHEAGRPASALAGEFSSFIQADLESDTDQLINWVGVKGGSVQNGLYSSVVMDSDPNSPTSVNRIGYRMFWWNNGNPDPLIASQADADNRALYEYRQRKRWQEQVPLTMEELPFLQPWDVLRIRNPEIALDDNYQITAYTVPLEVPPSYRGEMQATGWKVRT
jgi:hypothetical protein